MSYDFDKYLTNQSDSDIMIIKFWNQKGVLFTEGKIVVVIKGILLQNGRALILKRADDDEIGGGTWEFSGGKLEFGESPQEALKREFKEETGIDVEVKRLLYVTSFKTNPNRQVVLITYLCDCGDCDVKLSFEHSDWMWANREEVKSRISQGIADDIGANDLWGIFSDN